MEQQVLDEVLDRLLGLKVCLEEVMQISPMTKERMAVFDAALDAAVEMEEELVALGAD